MKDIEKLYKKSRNRHLKTIRNILKGNQSAAEDIFQEAICRAITYYPSFNPKIGKLENWFARILFNELSRWLRKEKKHRVEDIDHYKWAEDCIDYNDLLDNLIDIKSHISSTKDDNIRNILELVYIYGYSYNEVSGMVGLSKTAIRQICYRFREKIRHE